MKNSTVNIFSVDVEDWYQVTNYARSIPFETWGRYTSRLLDNTLRLLDLMGQYDVKGTFFILGWNAERFPDVVRAIDRGGHEIGTHGYHHRLIYEQTPEELRAMLKRSIRVLENLIGRPVITHRASDFSITRHCLWAFEVLCDMGIRYDSSVFPIRRVRYGIVDAPRFPYRIALRDGRGLIEVPLSTYRVMGQNLPIAGGGYLRLLPYRLTHRAIERLNREKYPAVLYIHPWEIDPDQPMPDGVPFKSLFAHRLNLSTTYQKLDVLMRDFRFAPMSRVVEERLS
ncbi:MAG: DUF3473 domain-containing protein [Candidatus Latescibacteria bacterium]|nr:DUF3473 domain-containing protein [Candidatus Latescibacterota bacterium]